MIDRVVMKSEVEGFLDELTSRRMVVAPVADGKLLRFQQVGRAAEVAHRILPTALPPRKYVLPTDETLFAFHWEDGGVEISPHLDTTEIVMFGVPPCDLSALALLDTIFAADHRDGHYFARREHVVVMGRECLEPCDEHAFCADMGTLEATDGFDLLLTDIGDSYYVRVGTVAGRDLIAGLPGTREAIYEDRARLRKAHEKRDAEFEHRLDTTPEQLPGLLAESFDSLLWDVLGEKCLSCGTCNIVCPTCYCFDINDSVDLDFAGGERHRVWDSCQLREFAMVGTGESFRESRAMRQKHRFYRKGKYIMDRYGRTACVGCGRCARGCLAKIDPIEVYNQLKGQPIER
jgi:formate hydrogenlyase subunit 6/NADH:ubiquinone oxidoreductase subunit I